MICKIKHLPINYEIISVNYHNDRYLNKILFYILPFEIKSTSNDFFINFKNLPSIFFTR